MTLPTGTALHHGHYVIDAFSAEDAIGPIYLATHIPSGRWVQLRILGSRHPEAIPFPEQRHGFYDYLLKVQTLNHPLFSGPLSGFEDGGVCYQVMEANLGRPLSQIITAQHPASPRQSIGLIQQIGHGLLSLQPLGWQGIVLTPDQFWQQSGQSTLTFTGFNFPTSDLGSDAPQEGYLVHSLSHLLYFLLTGQRAETTRAPLAVDVRNRVPGLPYDLDTALQLGSRQDVEHPSVSLKDWLELLPARASLPVSPNSSVSTGESTTPASPRSPSTGHPTPPGTQVSPSLSVTAHQAATQVVAVSLPSQASHSRPQNSRPWAPVALTLTAMIASFSGLGAGLMARLQPSGPSGSSVRLNPEQSFPPLADWSGDDPVEDWDFNPARRSFPDYGDRPPQPVARPEQFTQPSLSVLEEEPLGSSHQNDAQVVDSETASSAAEEDFFSDTPESFTEEADVTPTAPAGVQEPTLNDMTKPSPESDPGQGAIIEPPPPLSQPSKLSVPPVEAPPPLTAPAPLPNSPSAPVPSTS